MLTGEVSISAVHAMSVFLAAIRSVHRQWYSFECFQGSDWYLDVKLSFKFSNYFVTIVDSLWTRFSTCSTRYLDRVYIRSRQ